MTDIDCSICSRLRGLAPIQDPRDSIIEGHILTFDWNVQQRLFKLLSQVLKKLHRAC